MMAWADGYVTDIEYTSDFYRETSPLHLNFAILGQGYRPPTLDKGATYCELGCGQGLGTSILAAANPQLKFWGVDFNPAHIDNARRLAEAASLRNVTFLDHSFEQLTGSASQLPLFDYIVLHGIYSWISEANRSFIVRFIARHLKPGGVAYVSYNALPGWSVTAPLQRLVREHAARHPDRSDHQVDAAFEFANKFIQAKAGYFEQNPIVGKRLKKLPRGNRHYLAHEYLNGHWHPLYHLDVAAEMSEARLSYVASATLVENFDRLSIPVSMLDLVRDSRDRQWAETVRDFARNQHFRRDVFMRGATRMKGPEHIDQLAAVRLALMVPPSMIKYDIDTALGKITTDQSISVPVLNALALRPHTIGELSALPALKGVPAANIVGSISLLVHSGQIHPTQSLEALKLPGPSRELNKAIVSRLISGEVLFYVAVPTTGTGMRISFPELLLLSWLQENGTLNLEKAALAGWSKMERTGQRLIREGKRIESKDENVALLGKEFGVTAKSAIPVWKSLGII